MTVQADSFVFSGVDMLETYGIRVIASDFLKPKLRSRKVTVPTRDGAYDFGARYYDERQLRLTCHALERRLDRHEIRELALLLSRKGRIYLWDEPDKYYIGRIYNAPNLQYVGMAGHRFDLIFDCEPFAYGETYDGVLPQRIEYAGTARTPARISITSTSAKAIRGLQIRIRERRE